MAVLRALPEAATSPTTCSAATAPTLGVHYDGPRWALHGAIQYVRVENLPRGAIGPGLLGNGGAYFFQAAGTFSYQFYLRALSAAFRASASRRLSIEVGPAVVHSPEPMAGPADPAESLAQRTAGRPAARATWRLALRAGLGRRARPVGAAAGSGRRLPRCPRRARSRSRPTCRIDRRRASRRSTSPPRPAPCSSARGSQAFAIGYRDTRDVRARPDNSGVPATAADVVDRHGRRRRRPASIPPVGGAWDLTAWRPASSATGTASRTARCRRWPKAATAGPRRRGGRWCGPGVVYASGDGDGDGRPPRHVLHDAALGRSLRAVEHLRVDERRRRVGRSAARAAPRPRICRPACTTWRLASSADRWYSGSGATERRGNYFGYLGRNTRGAGTLGTIVEGEVLWQPVRWWTLARLRWPTSPAATPWAPLFADRRLFTATLVSRFSF